jgi:hypothetical protein
VSEFFFLFFQNHFCVRKIKRSFLDVLVFYKKSGFFLKEYSDFVVTSESSLLKCTNSGDYCFAPGQCHLLRQCKLATYAGKQLSKAAKVVLFLALLKNKHLIID